MNEGDKEQIRAAIRRAEGKTSAEIRVHVESSCDDPARRVHELFERFSMTGTFDRTGILIYIATESRCLAVLSDRGIEDKKGQTYWRAVEADATRAIREKRLSDALVLVIDEIGNQLEKEFPWRSDGTNEIADRIIV